VVWRWLKRERDEIRGAVEADDERSAAEDVGGLLDGCCLAGCLLPLAVLAAIIGGGFVGGVAAARAVWTRQLSDR
jgi:hypothetical protein